jgi:hypothetical protein
MAVIAPLHRDALGFYVRIGALTFRPTALTLHDNLAEAVVTVHEPFKSGGIFRADVQESADSPYLETWPESRIGGRGPSDAQGPCVACGGVYVDDGDDRTAHEQRHEELGFVSCDDFCPAKDDPETREEFILAYTHWRRHKNLSGCSHGR